MGRGERERKRKREKGPKFNQLRGEKQQKHDKSQEVENSNAVITAG